MSKHLIITSSKTAIPSGERNFHIFYYLIAGPSPEERLHLHLLDKTMYRYLGPRGTTSTRPNEGRDDNSLRFDRLKIALKTIGKTACRSNMSTSRSYPPLKQPRIHYRPASKRRCCCCPQHRSFGYRCRLLGQPASCSRSSSFI